jgi:hypothetical protein
MVGIEDNGVLKLFGGKDSMVRSAIWQIANG